MLTTYDGEAITYDAIGNPLTYRDGIILTWQNGRELASFSNSSYDITYSYDASGMRTSKTIDGVGTSSYVYESGLLMQMDYLGYVFDFSYDAYGSPIGFRFNNDGDVSYYYYGTNSRGDVIAIYDESGTKVATYSYDAYGKFLGRTYTASNLTYNDTVAINYNPLRYRGYVYDNETGFYYLQSRYYDPTTCRFVNGDTEYISTGQDINGNNMFAYCGNNPIIRVDSEGNLWWVAKAVVGAVVGFVESAVSTWLTGGSFTDGLISGVFGATEGAINAVVPSAAPIVSSVIGAGESIALGIKNGDDTHEIVSSAFVGATFGVLNSSRDCFFTKEKNLDKTIDILKSIPKTFKGNHPTVKNIARKTIKSFIKKSSKTIICEAIETAAYIALEHATGKYVNAYAKSVRSNN